MKRVLIDVNSVVPYYALGQMVGIGRTTMELVHALDQLPDLPVDIHLYSQNMKGIGGRDLHTRFPVHHLYLPYREKWNRVLQHLPVVEWMTRYDLLHIPHNFAYVHRPERCIVTIHDTLFFSHPEGALDHEFTRTHCPRLAQRCRAILTCSECSKRDIVRYMNVPEEKIHVVYWGIDRNILYPRPKAANHYCGNSPYFISASCSTGRKNTPNLIRAFERFARNHPEHHLILVWRTPPQEVIELSDQPPLRGRLHFARNISNEELATLYSGATSTFFPSRYEGFGLPVLESMAAGTPVVTCRNSSLEEVGGDAAIYIDPDDIEGMASLMEQFENNSLPYDELRSKGLLQASRFDWKTAARQTLSVYQQYL